MAYFRNIPLHTGSFCKGYKCFIKRLNNTDLLSSKYLPNYYFLLLSFLESETIYSKEIKKKKQSKEIFNLLFHIDWIWSLQNTISIVSSV